jgi:hemerythrin-like metal-binding protein
VFNVYEDSEIRESWLDNVMNEFNAILIWDENYFTGIPEIDEQHKRLVHLVNLLADSIANEPDINYLNYIFTELAEYSMYHFQTEENIWHQYLPDDPWEIGHEMEHSSFISIIIKLEKEEQSNPLDQVLKNVLLFLTDWLSNHILQSDKRMAKAVLARQSGLSLVQAKLLASQEMNKPT